MVETSRADGIEALSDEALHARREQLAYDVRSDPELRDDLLDVEREIARRTDADRRDRTNGRSDG